MDPILSQPDAFNTCYKSIFNKSIPDVAQISSALDKSTRYTRVRSQWIYKCFNHTGKQSIPSCSFHKPIVYLLRQKPTGFLKTRYSARYQKVCTLIATPTWPFIIRLYDEVLGKEEVNTCQIVHMLFIMVGIDFVTSL